MGTATIDISSGPAAQNQPGATERVTGLLLRQFLLLIACVPLTLAPYVAPRDVIETIPPFSIVVYYSVLSLLAGWFSIKWLWQMARLVLAADREENHRRRS